MFTVATLVASLLPFAVAMSFTPAPNNLMLANSGAQFGYARTLPHQAGVVLGFAALTLTVGFGVAGVIAAAPGLYLAMKYASMAYLLYLAWRIATAESAKPGATPARPMTLVQAALFQWINPKAWVTTLGAITTYTSLKADMRVQVLVVALVMAVVSLASTSTWAVFGQVIRRYLTTPRRRHLFNWSMAALLVASVAPALFEH